MASGPYSSDQEALFAFQAIEKFHAGLPLTPEEQLIINRIKEYEASQRERRAFELFQGMLSGRVSSCNERKDDEYYP